MTSITIDNVSRHYGAFKAVEGISLDVVHGEFLTLLGASGCGKTTTLRMIAGLERNDCGTIAIGDVVVSDAARKYFVQPDRRSLGMVFQSYAIWPHMTVFANVAYPLEVRRRPAKEVHSRVIEALRMVEMEQFADRPAPALSGGQQQRVAIARAIVSEPDVLLLDEPLSNLDAKLRVQMGDEFRLLQKRLGITCVYVTHDQGEALALSDRIVVMKSGRILQSGAPEDLYFRPNGAAVASFFGAPNLLRATVKASAGNADGLWNVQVGGAGWHGSALADRPMAPGAEALVMVRPENLSVLIAGKVARDDVTRWHGRVVRSVFRGSLRQLVVSVGDDTMNVEVNAAINPAVGDQVVIQSDRDRLWAFPGEDAEAGHGVSVKREAA